MGFDVNNQFRATFFGKDRLGFITPDCEASEILRPFLPVPYPAPWLPIRRRDEAHPVAGGVVLSSNYVVGLDANGALIPAGLRSGPSGNGGEFCLLSFGSDDVGFTLNPKTGVRVAATTEYVLLAAPSEQAAALATTTGTVSGGTLGQITLSQTSGVFVGTYLAVVGAGTRRVTALNTSTKVATVDSNFSGAVTGASVTYGVPTIDGITPTSDDITWALACTLIPGGIVRPIGYVIRNVFQYLGGVDVSAYANGAVYTLDPMNPTKAVVTNYMHEPGTAIQTSFVLRVPWIGAVPTTLQTLATAAGLSAAQYAQDDWSRSFLHMTGTAGASAGQFFAGCSVVPSDFNGAKDAGHFVPYDSSKHTYDQICGRVIGIEHMYPIRDYADRVRTQFDRGQEFVGAFKETHPQQMQMGGSATRGLPTDLHLPTAGLLRALLNAGVTSVPNEAATYAYIAFRAV